MLHNCYKVNIKALYLHVAFGRNVTIIAIATQGRDSETQWVTSYTLSVSNDGSMWRPYTQDSVIRVRNIKDILPQNAKF